MHHEGVNGHPCCWGKSCPVHHHLTGNFIRFQGDFNGMSWDLMVIEGSLEVKLPTISTDEKQRWSRRIEKRRAEEKRSEKRKSQKKEDADARKGKKVAKRCVFPMI